MADAFALLGIKPPNPPLVAAVMKQESGGRDYAANGDFLTSPKGARGRMQVMPATQRNPGYGITPARSDHPDEIARVGEDLLQAMMDRYNGNTTLAFAAYNAGAGNVDKWIGQFGDPRTGEISDHEFQRRIPFAETRAYVPNVQANLGASGSDTLSGGAGRDAFELLGIKPPPVAKGRDAFELLGITPPSQPQEDDGFDAALKRQSDPYTMENIVATGPDLALSLAKGLSTVAGVVPNIAEYATSGYADDDGMLGSIYRGSKGASDIFSKVGSAFGESQSPYSKLKQQETIVGRNDKGELVWHTPNLEQIKDVFAGSIGPGGIIGKGGQVLSTVAAKIPGVGPRLAKVIGYGVSNAGFVAPQTFDQTLRTAYDYYLKEKKLSPDKAMKAAIRAANKAGNIMLAASGVTGGVSSVAARQTGKPLTRFLRGGTIEAAPEGVEEGTQSAAGDIGMDRPVNVEQALSNAALGLGAGFGQGGVFAGLEGAPDTQAPPDIGTPGNRPSGPALTTEDIVPQENLPQVPLPVGDYGGVVVEPTQEEAALANIKKMRDRLPENSPSRAALDARIQRTEAEKNLPPLESVVVAEPPIVKGIGEGVVADEAMQKRREAEEVTPVNHGAVLADLERAYDTLPDQSPARAVLKQQMDAVADKAIEVLEQGKRNRAARKLGVPTAEQVVAEAQVVALERQAASKVEKVIPAERGIPAVTPQTKVAPVTKSQTKLNHDAKLPHHLAGAKPRYGYGAKNFTLGFESDIDKSAYTVAGQAKKSKMDAEYRAFLHEQGMDDGQIAVLGQAVKDRIKAQARDAPAGGLQVGRVAYDAITPPARVVHRGRRDIKDSFHYKPRKTPDKRLSLLEYIAARGGIEDVGGELKAMDLDKWHRGVTFRKKLIRPHNDAQGNMLGTSDRGNRTADDVAYEVWEAGYFPPHVTERPTVNDLLDLISEDAAGKRVYSFHDEVGKDEPEAALAQEADNAYAENRYRAVPSGNFTDIMEHAKEQGIEVEGRDEYDVLRDLAVDAAERKYESERAAMGEADIQEEHILAAADEMDIPFDVEMIDEAASAYEAESQPELVGTTPAESQRPQDSTGKTQQPEQAGGRATERGETPRQGRDVGTEGTQGEIELSSGAIVPSIKEAGYTLIKNGQQYTVVFDSGNGRYNVSGKSGMTLDEAIANQKRRESISKEIEAEKAAGIKDVRSDPYGALSDLTRNQITRMAKALKVKFKSDIPTGSLIERIVEGAAIPDRKRAYDSVVETNTPVVNEQSSNISRKEYKFGEDNNLTNQTYSLGNIGEIVIIDDPRIGGRIVKTVNVSDSEQKKGYGQSLYIAALKDGDILIREKFRGNEAKRVYDSLVRRNIARIISKNGKEYLSLAPEQSAIPGTEAISDKQLAERGMEGRKQATVNQKPVASDGGLFSDESKQRDMLDTPGKFSRKKITLRELSPQEKPTYSKSLGEFGGEHDVDYFNRIRNNISKNLDAELVSKGMKYHIETGKRVYGKAKGIESKYYQLPDGRQVRISNHSNEDVTLKDDIDIILDLADESAIIKTRKMDKFSNQIGETSTVEIGFNDFFDIKANDWPDFLGKLQDEIDRVIGDTQGQPLFRKGERVSSLTKADVTRAITKRFGKHAKKLIDASRVRIVQGIDDLPGNPAGYYRDTQGFYSVKGNVYLVADNLADTKQAENVFIHEAGVHAGMRNIMGDRPFEQVLKAVQRMVDKGNKHAAAAHKKAVDAGTPEADVAEETLAYMVDSAPDLPLVKAVISKVKRWLHDNFGIGELSPEDYRQIAIGAIRGWAKQQGASGGGMYSKAGKLVTDNPNFVRWFGNSKVVDAEGRPLVVYHGTGGDIDSFSRDKPRSSARNGYYFTDDSDNAGEYSQPIWNEDTRKNNYHSSGNIIPAYLSIKKPMTVDARGSWHGSIKPQGKVGGSKDKDGNIFTIYEPAQPEDIINTPPSKRDTEWRERSNAHKRKFIVSTPYKKVKNYADDNLTTPEAEEILINLISLAESDGHTVVGTGVMKMITGKGKDKYYYQEPIVRIKADYEGASEDIWSMAERAEKEGYDGLIVKNLRDSGSIMGTRPATTYVAFSPTQIKSIHNDGTYGTDDARILFSRKSKDTGSDIADDDTLVYVRPTRLQAAKKAVANSWKHNLTKEGLLNKEAFAEKIAKQGTENADDYHIAYMAKDFERDVKEVYSKPFNKLSDVQKEQLNAYLQGEDVAIPAKMKERLAAMRGYLDTATSEVQRTLIEQINLQLEKMTEEQRAAAIDYFLSNGAEGNVPEYMIPKLVLLNKLEVNKGKYLTRSFRAFRDKEWGEMALASKPIMRVAREGISGRDIARNVGEASGWRDAGDFADAFTGYWKDSNKDALYKSLEKRLLDNAMREISEEEGSDYLYEGTKRKRPIPAITRANKRFDAIVEAIESKRGEIEESLMTLAQVDREIKEILEEARENGNFISFISRGGKLGSKDMTLLKKRKDLPEWYKMLLGEFKDPKVNFVQSATKMTHYVANHDFLMSVRKKGLDSGFLREEKSAAEENDDRVAKIAADGSDAMSPLNGLYGTREFKQGMADAVEVFKAGGFLGKAIQASNLIKMGKTLYSPAGQVRNFRSNAMISIKNGHADPRKLALAAKTIHAELTGHGSDYVERLIRLGVQHDGVTSESLRHTLREATGSEKLTDYKFFTIPANLYKVGDDFWKVIGFEVEKSNLIDSGMKEAEAEKLAARRIRDIYPTYSMTPRLINILRQWPFLASFPSWSWEIMRTTNNSVRMIGEDYHAGRTSMAAKRLAGHIVAAAFSDAAAIITAMLYGLSDDEEKAMKDLSVQQEIKQRYKGALTQIAALRDNAPPWSRDFSALTFGRDENGMLEYYDMSYDDPFDYLKRPLRALANRNYEDFQKGMWEATKQAISPYFGLDIGANAAVELIMNQNDKGQQVYDPDNFLPGMLEHIVKTFQPSFVPLAKNIRKSVLNDVLGERQESPSGKEYKLRDTIPAFLGFKRGTMNAALSLKYKAGDYERDTRNAAMRFNRISGTSGTVSMSDVDNGYEAFQHSYQKAGRKIIRNIESARTLGATDVKIIQALKFGAVPKKQIALFLRGVNPPWIPTDTYLQTKMGGAAAVAPNKADEGRIRTRMLERQIHIRKRAVADWQVFWKEQNAAKQEKQTGGAYR